MNKTLTQHVEPRPPRGSTPDAPGLTAGSIALWLAIACAVTAVLLAVGRGR